MRAVRTVSARWDSCKMADQHIAGPPRPSARRKSNHSAVGVKQQRWGPIARARALALGLAGCPAGAPPHHEFVEQAAARILAAVVSEAEILAIAPVRERNGWRQNCKSSGGIYYNQSLTQFHFYLLDNRRCNNPLVDTQLLSIGPLWIVLRFWWLGLPAPSRRGT